MPTALAVAGVVLAAFLVWRLWSFFRDPDRVAPAAPRVLAAADGTVVYVQRVRAGDAPMACKRGHTILQDEHLGAPGLGPGNGVLVGTYMASCRCTATASPSTARWSCASTARRSEIAAWSA